MEIYIGDIFLLKSNFQLPYKFSNSKNSQNCFGQWLIHFVLLPETFLRKKMFYIYIQYSDIFRDRGNLWSNILILFFIKVLFQLSYISFQIQRIYKIVFDKC